MQSAPPREPSPLEGRLAMAVLIAGAVFHLWGMTVGWQSRNLPANEFRESQTALSAYWIKQENNFSLAYPTPVLGKPWSIPMEFPLYQWTVVATGKLTGWGLTKAGRAVSIACFYLTLPAIFLLLQRWRIAPARRWLVLALVLTCPFYIFYTRAFLIETMALMFSVWFWVAFERAVAGRSKTWLAVAAVAGTGAGLVKVTTFMVYLLPAGAWAVTRLWAARRQGWKTEVAWMTTAVALPFAATLAWLDFADRTKALNPLATFLTSANLTDFNFGTNETRFSAAMWAAKLRIVRDELSWWPALLVCAMLAPLFGRARWRETTACGAFFAAALMIFPVLYYHHVYYYAANTLLLLLAMGLVWVALAESRAPRWLVAATAVLLLAGQAGRYLSWYYPHQRPISPGTTGLTISLQALTHPGDAIVVAGQDWNSALPYYAQRRAVMLRHDTARDPGRIEQAFAALGATRIGAVVILGPREEARQVLDRAAAHGISREPVYVWRDALVFLPEASRTELIHAILDQGFREVALAPGVEPPKLELRGRWVELAALRRWQRRDFNGFQPAPVRFFASFGPGADSGGGQLMFGAHPVTRLVFALPAGRHTLRSSLQMASDAYRLDLPDDQVSDGVEVSLFKLGPGEERQLLTTRYFDPRHNADDRGPLRPFEYAFTLEGAGEVELFFGPGPTGRDTRDWIQLGPLTID